MALEAVTRQLTLGDVVEQVIAELKAKYPTAEFLINDEVYGDEDIDIDAYVDEELIVPLDRFANELRYVVIAHQALANGFRPCHSRERLTPP